MFQLLSVRLSLSLSTAKAPTNWFVFPLEEVLENSFGKSGLASTEKFRILYQDQVVICTDLSAPKENKNELVSRTNGEKKSRRVFAPQPIWAPMWSRPSLFNVHCQFSSLHLPSPTDVAENNIINVVAEYVSHLRSHCACSVKNVPRVTLTNNLVENAIRPTAIGKKDWLFIGEADAGQRSAIVTVTGWRNDLLRFQFATEHCLTPPSLLPRRGHR